jgi:guanylate kinase
LSSAKATGWHEERERRLQTAREELAAEAEFDMTIVNTDVASVCEELVTLLGSSPNPARRH